MLKMKDEQEVPDVPQEPEVHRSFEEAFERRQQDAFRGEDLYRMYLASSDEIRRDFIEIWQRISHVLEPQISPQMALSEIKDLVVYDIPDGTRSTLTVHKNMDTEADAGMWCLSLIHTLRSLGAKKVVLMTHTAYNRDRGEEELARIMSVLERGIAPLADYSSKHRVQVYLVGMDDKYELSESLLAAFPEKSNPDFETYFLLDYREEFFLEDGGRDLLNALPDIDVVIRHTKLHVSGGWVPSKTLHSTYLYCQNGSLYSNWTADEYVFLIIAGLLAKKLNEGETLTKRYSSVEEIKRRYQQRELGLSHRMLKIREKPKKLFMMGSPFGLLEIQY